MSELVVEIVQNGEKLVVEIGTLLVLNEGGGPGGASFTHTQSSPSADWVVNHNLGYRPVVEVLTTGGVLAEVDIVHTSLNQFHVYSAAAFAGTARCV